MQSAVPASVPLDRAHPLLAALSVFAPSARAVEPLAPGSPPSQETGDAGSHLRRPADAPTDPGAGQGELLATILTARPATPDSRRA
ncbi:hypothetical protein [Streptomyces sp. NPDC054794]